MTLAGFVTKNMRVQVVYEGKVRISLVRLAPHDRANSDPAEHRSDARRRPMLEQERPNPRRLSRIALYKAIIGHGHERILELGCGSGDLAYALVGHAQKIVATDIDSDDIERARCRADLWSLSDEQIKKIEFRAMSALELDFSENEFDWAISTSMVEHLDPRSVERHLREVHRVLKSNGSYLIWCPNGLGRHEDQAGHLTMWSYREWVEKLRNAGFRRFRSTLTSRPPLVDARWKIILEAILSRSRSRIMWSHLGVRNILLIATK